MELEELHKKYGKPKKHLFIICPNNSGSTSLLLLLSNSKNCVNLRNKKMKVGEEGFNALFNITDLKGKYISPFNTKIVIAPKLFTSGRIYLENEEYWNWAVVRHFYYASWYESAKEKNKSNLDNKVVLVKSPQNVYYAHFLKKYFPNSKFILMTRNPYAVTEGMLRQHNYEIRRALPHWIQTAKKINELRKTFSDEEHIYITYEEMCDKTEEVEQKLKDFLPELKDINLKGKIETDSIYGRQKMPLINLNTHQINKLTEETGTDWINDINEELKNHLKLMQDTRQEYILVKKDEEQKNENKTNKKRLC